MWGLSLLHQISYLGLCFEWKTRDVYKIFLGKLFRKQALGRVIRRWRNNIKICLREITFGNVMRFNYESFQTLKIQNKWERKGNHCCEGGNTVMSSILPFPFVFAFEETSGLPEVSWKWKGEKSHYMVLCASGRALWHRNTKTRTEAKQMPWQRWWLCWKIADGICSKSFFTQFC